MPFQFLKHDAMSFFHPYEREWQHKNIPFHLCILNNYALLLVFSLFECIPCCHIKNASWFQLVHNLVLSDTLNIYD